MKYLGAYIARNEDGLWYWKDSCGVVGGEGFDSLDECKADVEFEKGNLHSFNRGPFAY